MKYDNVLQTVSSALGAALYRDLTPRVYKDSNGIERAIRPYEDDVDVHVFPQTWSSTTLTYGGIGGQVMTTPAYTVIVSYLDEYCVYFGGPRLAYKVDLSQISRNSRESFLLDMKNHRMQACNNVGLYREPKEKKSTSSDVSSVDHEEIEIAEKERPGRSVYWKKALDEAKSAAAAEKAEKGTHINKRWK